VHIQPSQPTAKGPDERFTGDVFIDAMPPQALRLAGMSVFTDSELQYLAGQRLGRIATVGPDGQPHVVPTSFRYNAEHDAIDVRHRGAGHAQRVELGAACCSLLGRQPHQTQHHRPTGPYPVPAPLENSIDIAPMPPWRHRCCTHAVMPGPSGAIQTFPWDRSRPRGQGSGAYESAGA
jgi:Pyridoxamine 5'-phosphate oxidase